MTVFRGVEPLNWLKVFDPEWDRNYEIAEIRFGGSYRLDSYPSYGERKKYAAHYRNGFGYEFLFGEDATHHRATYIYDEADAKAFVQRHYSDRVKALLTLEDDNA